MTTIVIPGPPMPKPRGQRSDKWKSPPRPCIVKYREFKDRVRVATSGRLDLVMSTGVVHGITIYLDMPNSWTAKRKAACAGQPARGQGRQDIDNHIKGLLDTMFLNDGFIWRIGQVEKRWADEQGPRVELLV